jgi:capsular polysaccharide transport system permease protein
MPKTLDLPAGKDGEPVPKISPDGGDRAPVAPDAEEAQVGDPASVERPRKAPAGFFATLLQSEKIMEKWLLSCSASRPKREERPASRAPRTKPVPTPPLPLGNETRKGAADDLRAQRHDMNAPKADADTKRSKAPSVTPVATLPVRLGNQRHPSAAVGFQAQRAGAMLPAIDGLLPLPQIARRRSYGTLISFVLCALLPTFAIAACLYLYASDEYYAEFRFSVQQGVPVLPGTTPATSSTSSGSSSGSSNSPPGVTSLLASSPSPLGGSAPSPTVAMPQNFMVNDYFISQKAVEDLQSRINIKALYSRPEINWLERFDARQPMEEFVAYFHRFFFWADYDQVTGVAIATVKAITPQDALLIAKTMAALSENLINEMNARADGDAVRFAEAEAQRAEKRLNDARAELLEFRTKAGVISPNAGTAPSVLTKEQVVQLQRHAAQDTGGAHAFADVIGTYEKITFDVQYAQDSLVRARQALDLARANAAVQHFYIEPYVTPQLPESPAYPLRALDTCLAGLACFGIWLLGLLLVRTVQDHVN